MEEQDKKVLINMEPTLPDDVNHDTMFTLKVDESSDALKGFVTRQKLTLIFSVILVVLFLLTTGLTVYNVITTPKQTGLVAVIEAEFAPTNIPDWDTNAQTPVKEDHVEKLNEKLDKGKMCINMASRIAFEDSYSMGKVNIYNDESNNYPQFVTIALDSTGQQILQTGLIEVGKGIMQAPLEIALPKGTYECTAVFTQVDTETNKVCGQAAAKITITILN